MFSGGKKGWKLVPQTVYAFWPNISPMASGGQKRVIVSIKITPWRNTKAEQRYGQTTEITTWAKEKNKIICINKDICPQWHYAKWN